MFESGAGWAPPPVPPFPHQSTEVETQILKNCSISQKLYPILALMCLCFKQADKQMNKMKTTSERQFK